MLGQMCFYVIQHQNKLLCGDLQDCFRTLHAHFCKAIQKFVPQHLFSPMRGNTSYLASHADILHYKLCNYTFRSTSQPVKSTSRATCTLLLRWPPEPRQLNCTLKKPISLQWQRTTLDKQLSFNRLHWRCLWSGEMNPLPFPLPPTPTFLPCLSG